MFSIHGYTVSFTCVLIAAVAGSLGASQQVLEEDLVLGPADGADDDEFGFTIALDSDTLVVGSPLHDYAGNDIGHVPFGAPLDYEITPDTGAVYVFERSGTAWSSQGKLVPSALSTADRFGYSVSISGDTIVVGSPNEDGAGPDAGAVFVFVRNGSAWVEQAVLLPSDRQRGDAFGFSVQIDEDTVVVGAPGDDDAGLNAGSAYVFCRSGTSWNQVDEVFASDAGLFETFGRSVSISGDAFVVAALRATTLGQDGYVLHFSGGAYVFRRTGPIWIEEVKLDSPGGVSGDEFGHAVSINGDDVAVTAVRDSDPVNLGGAVYVFSKSGAQWNQQAKLQPSDSSYPWVQQFGRSVSLRDHSLVATTLRDAYVFLRRGTQWTQEAKLLSSDNQGIGYASDLDGDTVVAGAKYAGDTGRTYVFTLTPFSGWPSVELHASDAGDGDLLGTSVAFDGDRLIAGAQGWDGTTANGVGAAYVFLRNGTDWSEEARLVATQAYSGDWFGAAVSIWGDRAVVGAPANSNPVPNGGAVHVYARQGTVWTEQALIQPDDLEAHELFGSAVDIEGDRFVVGAPSMPIITAHSGAVRVYDWNGTAWNESSVLSADLDPTDLFGTSVDLDGDRIAVSAPQDDDVDFNAGAVYVYVRIGTTWIQESKLVPFDGTGWGRFGTAVKLSGTRLIASNDDQDIYTFERTGGSWALAEKFDPMLFGLAEAIGLSGDLLIAGDPHDITFGSSSGSVFVYERVGGRWVPGTTLRAPDGYSGQEFGTAVAIRGNTVVVGVVEDDDLGLNAGSVYVFEPPP